MAASTAALTFVIACSGSQHSTQSHAEAFTTSDGVDYSKRENHLRWYDWFKVAQFYKVGILYMGTRLVINLTQSYTPFYIQYTLNLTRASIAYIPLLMYVSGFFSSFIMKPINARIGKKWTYTIGGAISLIGAFNQLHLTVIYEFDPRFRLDWDILWPRAPWRQRNVFHELRNLRRLFSAWNIRLDNVDH